MPVAISRQQFLRGDFSGRRSTLRPPWALAEQEFVERCTRCGACEPVCPARVIRIGRGGFPIIDFSGGACTFCGECVRVCEPRALHRADGRAPWSLQARVADACIAQRGVVCRTCGEHCDAQAIRFRLRLGGAAQPHVDAQRCNGCGACVAVCPVQAIEMFHVEEVAQA